MKDFRLLVHHHAVAYIDENSRIWMPAMIARWVDMLAPEFEHIGLLVYQTEQKQAQQDTLIHSTNVSTYSLGRPTRVWDRWDRMRRLKRACEAASKEADGLLIRGVTPRQFAIWQSVHVKHKAFLLVGTLVREQSQFQLSLDGLYNLWTAYRRPRELRHMLTHGIDMMANSPTVVDQVKVCFGRDAKFVPTNTLSRKDFLPFEIRPLHSPRRLLYCGRVVEDKGIAHLIEALRSLHNYELDIVGQFTSLDRERFGTLAARLGVADRIRWHGRVPHGPALFKFYQQADALVLPTYHEGFPIVIWEAAANCCPIVTTRVGGIPGLWEHEKHGLLVAPYSSDELAAAIMRLENDTELRNRLIQTAYTHVMDYTLEQCVKILSETLGEFWSQRI